MHTVADFYFKSVSYQRDEVTQNRHQLVCMGMLQFKKRNHLVPEDKVIPLANIRYYLYKLPFDKLKSLVETLSDDCVFRCVPQLDLRDELISVFCFEFPY